MYMNLVPGKVNLIPKHSLELDMSLDIPWAWVSFGLGYLLGLDTS
jgi:hypothetical protein